MKFQPLLILCVCFSSMPTAVSRGAEPIDIGSRRELFVDQHLIERLDGARLVLNRPIRKERHFAPPGEGGYMTVLKDNDRYRAYYRLRGDQYYYAESKDGVNWEGRGTPILASDNFSPFLDTRPGVPKDERYKATARGMNDVKGSSEHLYGFVSADGIHWKMVRDEPILKHNPRLHQWRAFDSQNVAFWSEAEQRYVLYFRTFTGMDGTLGLPDGNCRTVSRATSEDFVNWTDESAEFQAPNLSGEQLYTSQTHPYFRAPHIYIALPTRLVQGYIKGERLAGTDPFPHAVRNAGSTDIVFMTTRAGQKGYTRLFKGAFMRPGLDSAAWGDRANYVALNVVPTGPAEMSLYHQDGHRYTLRTDGFVSARATSEGGELVTKPLVFGGRNLVLNLSTAARGGVWVELQTPEGTPLPGFSQQECQPIVDNSIERVVSWKSGTDVSKLSGKPVRLRFIMKDADLYAFQFTDGD